MRDLLLGDALIKGGSVFIEIHASQRVCFESIEAGPNRLLTW